MKILFLNSLLIILSVNLCAQNFQQIDSLISEGNYLRALEEAEQLVLNDSLNASAWQILGKTCQINQRYTQAIWAYEKADALNPGNKTLLLILAKTCNSAGNLQKAISTYKKVLALDSNNIAALTNLSILYLKIQNFKDAFWGFERLYQSDTLNSEYVRQMGYCKYRQGEILKAFELYKKSYQLNPENLKTIYWLADVYTNSQKLDSTINLVSKALKVYPANGKLYEKRGNAYFKRNHHYLSRDDYQKAIELGYQTYQLQKKLGKSLYVTKQYDSARATLERLIVRDTADYQVCMYLGEVYNQLKNYKKSILFYKYAVDLLLPAPLTMSATYRGMAKSYHDMGLYRKEIAVIKKRQAYYAQAYPSHEYLLEIAEIYEYNLHDKKSALKYYQRYYDKIKDFDDSYWKEKSEKTLAKINRLKEDLHFEN